MNAFRLSRQAFKARIRRAFLLQLELPAGATSVAHESLDWPLSSPIAISGTYLISFRELADGTRLAIADQLKDTNHD